MLREDKSCEFAQAGAFGRKRRFTAPAAVAPLAVSRRRVRVIVERSQGEPIKLLTHERESWWMFRGRVFREDEGYSVEDVHALLLERERRKERQLDRARAALSRERTGGADQRTAIPRDIKLAVWERDGGRCVECGSNRVLEFDHVIPIALGGSNTERNLQILCADCNRRKGDSL